MSNLIRWKIPDSTEVSYDRTYIYRSDTETGEYTELTSQAIATNYYFDSAGSDTDWYKVRFYSTTDVAYSSYSDVIQATKYIGYCSLNDIRHISHLSTTDISDTEMYEILKLSMAQLNADINTEIIREPVFYIDNTRKNLINNSNTDYYVKNWKKYIGDRDDDGDVDSSDVIVYQVASDGTETELTVSSVDANNGKITLETAPASSVRLYVTYNYTPVSVSDPHQLVKLACAYLTSYRCYNFKDFGTAGDVKFGTFAVKKARGKESTVEKLDSQYQKIIRQILALLPEIGFSEGEVI